MLSATLNEPIPLQVLAADGKTDLFAQIRIYNSDNDLLFVLGADHIAEGLYGLSWVPNIEGYYTIIAQFYYDADHTIDAGYEKQADLVDVSSVKTNILRLLGLTHENSVIDSQTYDSNGNMKTARIRTYDSKTNALAASDLGLKFQYSVSAEFINGFLSKYIVVRDN